VGPTIDFLRQFANPYTYDLRKNTYLWLGMFWGLLIPCFVFSLGWSRLRSEGGGPLEAFRESPIPALVLLLPPPILGILFGAAGASRRALELENARLLRSLETLAMTDPLTGLHNRRYIEEALNLLKEGARRSGTSVFVALLDLDGFKAVNDERGHLDGDRVICDAAAALKSALRQSDLLGRHGGDEFIVAGVGNREAALLLLERAAQAVHRATGLAISVGVGCWPGDGEDLDQLMASADRTLGTSKRRSHASRPPQRMRPDG
jgi:diguanylate cyclase (GGDEF)-like protein